MRGPDSSYHRAYDSFKDGLNSLLLPSGGVYHFVNIYNSGTFKSMTNAQDGEE